MIQIFRSLTHGISGLSERWLLASLASMTYNSLRGAFYQSCGILPFIPGSAFSEGEASSLRSGDQRESVFHPKH